MYALYKLQAKSYFSNIFSKVEFITTFLFLAVLGSLIVFYIGPTFGSDATITNPAYNKTISSANITIISSIVLLMIMQSALNTFGLSFYEMKDSVLLRRIGATKISKPQAIGSFILWGMTTMLFTIAWIAFLVGIMQIQAIGEATGGVLYVDPAIWTNANWGGAILTIIIVAVSVYAIAFFFVSIAPSSETYNIISIFYFFLMAFLGGSLTPNAGREWMTVIGYMSPLGWGRELMDASMNGLSVFNLTSDGGYVGATVTIPVDTITTNQPTTDQIDIWLQNNGYSDLNEGFMATDITLNFEANTDTINIESVTIYGTAPENLFMALGRFGFPVIYGGLAAGASVKFFKWD